MTAVPQVPPGVDPARPGPARIYDCFLGGTSHLPIDREAAQKLRTVVPGIAGAIRAEHTYLRSKLEVDQFFDGLELVTPQPGADLLITCAGLWGAEHSEAADTEGSGALYCGVGRRP